MAKSPSPRKTSRTKPSGEGAGRSTLKSALAKHKLSLEKKKKSTTVSKKKAPISTPSDPFGRFKKKPAGKPDRDDRDRRSGDDERSKKRKPLELDRDSKPKRFERADKSSRTSAERKPHSGGLGATSKRTAASDRTDAAKPKKIVAKRPPADLPIGERYRIAKRLDKKSKQLPASETDRSTADKGIKKETRKINPAGDRSRKPIVKERKSSSRERRNTSDDATREPPTGRRNSPARDRSLTGPASGSRRPVIDRPKRSHVDDNQAESASPKKVISKRGTTKEIERTPSESATSDGVRLNKYLAHAGIASRRAADTLIMQGHVTVNGIVVQEMGYKVQPNDVVAFKGGKIKPVDKLVYVLLNKPRNVMSTSSDERGRKTVLDIIAKKVSERIYPVGRLDRNTSGLILLTNDGELTKKLSHPSHKVPKVYHVTLDRPLGQKDMDTIRNGITLEDGEVKADSLHFVEDMSKRDVQIEMHSGKNRIVRRIFEHLGYEIVKLDRTYYAGLTKKNLPRGFFRPLTKEEIRMLKHFT